MDEAGSGSAAEAREPGGRGPGAGVGSLGPTEGLRPDRPKGGNRGEHLCATLGFSPLRELPAFAALEQDLGGLIHELGW